MSKRLKKTPVRNPENSFQPRLSGSAPLWGPGTLKQQLGRRDRQKQCEIKSSQTQFDETSGWFSPLNLFPVFGTSRFCPWVSQHPLGTESGLLSRRRSLQGATLFFCIFRTLRIAGFAEGFCRVVEKESSSRRRFCFAPWLTFDPSTRSVASSEDAAGVLWTSATPPGVSSPRTTATRWNPSTTPTTTVSLAARCARCLTPPTHLLFFFLSSGERKKKIKGFFFSAFNGAVRLWGIAFMQMIHI